MVQPVMTALRVGPRCCLCLAVGRWYLVCVYPSVRLCSVLSLPVFSMPQSHKVLYSAQGRVLCCFQECTVLCSTQCYSVRHPSVP